MSGLEIRNIQKSFGSQTALSAVDLSIHKGEFFSLLGPSGCGKSTLLRILGGLEAASSGEIFWGGERIDQRPARVRPFNMVFQKYALFPHLSVQDNVAFGLNIRNVARAEVKKRVAETLELVNLSGFESRLPETLSGGQAQRVALARAIINRPSCVLLDEPLTALDAKLREHMQTELRLLQKRLALTFIFVTHDQEEAMLLSDRVAVMNAGRVEQVSSPRDLYEHPSSLFTAHFIGRRNELVFTSAKPLKDGLTQIVVCGQPVFGFLKGLAQESSARAFVRPECIRVFAESERFGATAGTSAGDGKVPLNLLRGRVSHVLYRGGQVEVVVDLGEAPMLRALIGADAKLRAGDSVVVEFAASDCAVFADTKA